MKRLAIIPEIFIWSAFLLVAGFGYAFSFLGYIEHHVQMSVADIMLPTIVWFLLAVFCTFLLRVAQNTQLFIRFSKMESLFLESSVLLLLLVGGWIFRFVDYFQMVWPAGVDETFFEFAKVSDSTTIYANPHPASRLYVAFLRLICMFLGNIYELGALAQFVLLLAAVLLWYFVLSKAFSSVTALFFVAGAMLLPDSITASMQCNPMILLFLLYGFAAYVIVEFAQSHSTGVWLYVQAFSVTLLAAIAALMDISGVLLLAGVCYAFYYRQKHFPDSANSLNAIFSAAGLVLAKMAYTFVHMELYGLSFREAVCFDCYQGLQPHIPTLERVQTFAFSLGRHPIFIVAIVIVCAYWFLNQRAAFTWILAGMLYLFGVQLLQLDMYLQHDFLIYMGILVLVGISVQEYLRAACPEAFEKELLNRECMDRLCDVGDMVSEVAALEEPVVTVIRFEDQPAVTVPEMEKPLIFIPKNMEIPKRVSKPKVDYAIEIAEDKDCFDYEVDEDSDFDVE